MSEAQELPRLERPIRAATRDAFVEVVGRRIALLGREEGVFECWIWPLKVAHDLRLALRRADGTRVALADHAEHACIDPFELRLSHLGPDWRVQARVFAALDQRALVWLFEVETREPVTLEVQLTPDFRPMWPAGLGGQTARRDDESGACALAEELGRFAALLGSPEAEPVALDADHGLPRGSLTLSIPISPARAERGPIPFFVVGAELEPRPLSPAAKLGEEGAATGAARSREVLDAARELYRRALVEWPRWHSEQVAHWSDFLARTTALACDSQAHQTAFLWAKIAIERAWVEVDGLGRGLVAGLGPSRGGERPGFGWFFDGDALVAARALTLCGDFELTRRVLDFALSHQRSDGKLMHELVLSARLCDWLGDYPYAYYKGVNTPDFLGALGRYLDASGDVEFLRARWPAVERAFEHARACVDERGRYSVRRAGLCAVEAGTLVGRIESEIFAHGLWLEALCALRDAILPRLAAPQRERVGATVAHELERALRGLYEFADPASGAWSFACLTDGSRFADVSGYHGQVLQLALVGRHSARAATAARLNAPRLAADWGLRMFPTDSAVYDPEHYNTGSVFPYLQDFAIRGLFACGDEGAAHQLLRAQIGLDGFSGLGFVPEHLVGDRALAPERGVPHQIFSSSAILQATLAGELGLELRPGGLSLAPTPTPDRRRFALSNVRAGETRLELDLVRAERDGLSVFRLRARRTAGPPLELELAPRWPHGSRPSAAPARVRLDGEATLEVAAQLGPALFVPASPLARGAASSHPRLARQARDERSATWTVWGLAGRCERLVLLGDRRVAWRGARPGAVGELVVELGPGRGFVAREVRAEFLD